MYADKKIRSDITGMIRVIGPDRQWRASVLQFCEHLFHNFSTGIPAAALLQSIGAAGHVGATEYGLTPLFLFQLISLI